MPIFAKQGEYEPCGIFTKEHFLLILLTIIGIALGLIGGYFLIKKNYK